MPAVSKGNGRLTEQDRAQLAKERGVAAARIRDPERRRKFIAEQGEAEAQGKLGLFRFRKLREEAALE